MAESIRGNKTLSGTWGELWIDGEKIFEFSKIELKVTANREEVQIGIDVDSKITGLKGEGSYTVKKVYTRAKAILESWKKGKDVRCQIIAKLKDPDTLCTCVFSVCGGECGVMGWIKTTKDRHLSRQYELEDRETDKKESMEETENE